MRHPAWSSMALAALLAAGPVEAQTRQFSLALDGATQYLSVPDKTDLENLASMTIEAWVYPTSFADFPTIVGNDFQESYWFGFSESGNPRFYPNGGAYAQAPQTIALNQWTHVAVAFKGGALGQITFYIDGAEVHSVASSAMGTGGSVGDLRIGADRSAGGPDFHFQGFLDEVRIWGDPLSAPVLAAGMFERANNPGLGGGAYANLLAYWHMDDPWPTVPDRHLDVARGFGQGDNDAFFVSAPGSSLEAPPVSRNTAVLFDGVGDYVFESMPDGFPDGITIEAWVCPLSMSGFPTIVGRDYTSSFWLGFNTAGQLRFYPTGGGGNFVESTSFVAPGYWHHVAATYRNGVTRLYIDGNAVGVFTSISGPIGENGRDLYIGADNGAGGPGFFMNGMIDHVTVTRGMLSSLTIRRAMAYTLSTSSGTTPDFLGVPRERMDFDLSHRSNTHMGGNPHFVQGGTPRVAFGITSLLWETDYIHGFENHVSGTRPLSASIGSSAQFQTDVTITQLRAFVSVASTDMSTVEILLRHPDLTEITLLSAGEVSNSREMHSVFEDGANTTLATAWPPFDVPLQPHEPLAAFLGKNSMGFWRLQVNGGGALVGLIAWGLSFLEDAPVGVEQEAASAAVGLELAGTHPVRGTGRFALTLGHGGRVQLDLLDLQGRSIRPLLRGEFAPGRHMVQWNAQGLEPGVYFARLIVNDRESAGVKLTVVR